MFRSRGLAGYAACAVLMASTGWVHFYATTWYSTHRSVRYLGSFARGVGPSEGISRINNDLAQPGWFVRVWSGIPDCASGSARFAGSPEKYRPGRPVGFDDYLDGAGCAVRLVAGRAARSHRVRSRSGSSRCQCRCRPAGWKESVSAMVNPWTVSG
ncbi:hypothetical protein SAMN05421854_119120 [Amycolatopsis rubida]|uniref:Uncharacterized protein n=1 Tax=Amycolatopsis rubida TaxID=112413 RepID=A0A1I6AKR0_9PSEU|nr:hypothetical protein SAMN05421854_119120 [Amycolatopsis rubida]